MSRDETRIALDYGGVLMTFFAMIAIIAGACGVPIVVNVWTGIFFTIVLFFVTVKIVYVCKRPS